MGGLDHLIISCMLGLQFYTCASLWRIRRKLKIDPPGQLF